MLRFLCISLLFHGIAFGAWHYHKPWNADHIHGTAVAITLVANSGDREITAQKPPSGSTQDMTRNGRRESTAERSMTRTDTAKLYGEKTIQPGSDEQKLPGTENTTENIFALDENTGVTAGRTTRASTVIDTEINSSSIKAVKAAVALAFQANFRYPRIARRNDWEGTVTLKLRVLPNGQLENILISESSGFSALDNAARKTMQLASVPEAKLRLNGKPLDITVPVIYQLTDS